MIAQLHLRFTRLLVIWALVCLIGPNAEVRAAPKTKTKASAESPSRESKSDPSKDSEKSAKSGASQDAKPVEGKSPSTQDGGGGLIRGEIKELSEEVASRIDRIVKKKAFDLWGDPWTIQGIPLIFPSTDNGFNLGLRAALQNIRRQDPHKFELEGQMLASDLGRYKHFIKMDYPRAFDTRFRIQSSLRFDRDVSLRYFGIGNETAFDPTRFANGEYDNVRAGPSFNLSVLRNFSRTTRAGPILGFRWMEVTAPVGTQLHADQPTGIGGGRTHYIGLAVIDDNTDFEPYPSRGRSHELYLYWYAPFMGSDYNFFRFNYTYRHYIPLHQTLTLSMRLLFESLHGNVPFYELDVVGGQRPALGLGGDRFLRGFETNRFLDRIRLMGSVELRWDPLQFEFAKQEITLGFVPFVDIGRVWPSFWPLRLGDWHASAGWGVRFIWSNRFVVRADVALSAEGTGFVFEIGNSF